MSPVLWELRVYVQFSDFLPRAFLCFILLIDMEGIN